MEDLSILTIPEMMIRTQAALRAISALEIEISAGPPTAQIATLIQTGHQSQRRAVDSESVGSPNVRFTHAGLQSRSLVERAPLSPLAEITNTVSRPMRAVERTRSCQVESPKTLIGQESAPQLSAYFSNYNCPQPRHYTALTSSRRTDGPQDSEQRENLIMRPSWKSSDHSKKSSNDRLEKDNRCMCRKASGIST